MKKIKNNRGVTMIALAVTVVILTILAVTLTASMTSTIELKKYNNVKEDIIALSEDIKVYYMKNNALPIYNDIKLSLSTYGVPDEDMNPNDSEIYYPINLDEISKEIELNCGDGNKNKDFTTDDLYVVNESSLTVYYLKGVLLNGVKHYTIVDDFSGGSFANEYYSKVDLPIISVVTMESDGIDRTKASVNDTVTVKMLTNYPLTKLPSVTIGGHAVETTWNGNIGTATYKFPSVLSEDEADNVGRKIELKIEDYEADGRTGETINDVNFGNGVFLYAKERKLKVGDYVNYNYDSVISGYSLPSGVSGTNNDQTIPQTPDLKWRVLSVNDDGSVDLISEKPTNTNVYLGGALGYNNGVYVINDICAKQYSNSNLGVTARNLTIEDIENKMNNEGISARDNYIYDGVKYGDVKTYTENYRRYPRLYEQENGSGINTTIAKTDGIGRSNSYYKAPTTETYSQADTSLTVTKNYYNFGDITPSSYFFNDNFYSIIFETETYYWLASRSVGSFSTYVDFGLSGVVYSSLSGGSLFNSASGTYIGNGYLRPVVTIKGNYKVESADLSKDGSSVDLAYDIVVK